MPIPMLGMMGGLTPEQRRQQLAAKMGVAPPGVAAAAQQMGNAMQGLGPAPKPFLMPGQAPGAPDPASAAAAAAFGGPGAAVPGQPGLFGGAMPGPPPPQVAGPPPGPPPALADQIRQQYLAMQKAPMQQADVPMNKAGMLVNAMAGAGLGGAAAQSPGGLAAGAGLGLLAQHLKDRRSRKNLGTAQFKEGGVVRMAMGGAGKERKNYPKTVSPPKKNSLANPITAKGMGKATRGYSFKGSL